MDRRRFVTSLLSPLALTAVSPAFAMGGGGDDTPYEPSMTSPTVVERLGGVSLAEQRAHYQALLDEFIAYWDTGGIDWEFGGLMTRWDEKTGEFTTDTKDTYNMARGLWVFSYLYNHHGKNDRHRRAAQCIWDFLTRYCRDHSTGWWISKVTRGGKTIDGPVDIYGDMYVMLGLTEYYTIAGDDSLLDVAVETAHGINERIVSPDYMHLDAHKDGFIPGTKILGTWQHFLGSLTPLARVSGDNGVELMARMCVRKIMERHYSREYSVFFEYLDDRFRPFGGGYDPELRKISSWHSVQSAWMCMDEALRIGHRTMFAEAAEMGRKSLERCWLESPDGGLIGLDYPEQDVRDSSDKPDWGRLDDSLVLTLLAIENTHAPWAVRWFDTVSALGNSKPEQWSLRGLLHHPRRLFFGIEILDRMIASNGKVSLFIEG